MNSTTWMKRACLPAVALLATACNVLMPAAVPPPMTEPSGPPAEYVIGAGDVLGIRVWKNPELSVDVPVRPDGKISVPLLDDVQAMGLTTVELKTLLTQEMSEYIANPDITVVVNQMNSKRAFVIGEVRGNGAISLATETRVLDAIIGLGGFGPFANKKRVKVIRKGPDGQDIEYPFNYDAYVAGDAPGTNILLEPGDIVVVPD